MAITDNLSAIWRMDEASGTRVNAYGEAPDLSANGAVGSTTGQVGDAASFVAANNTHLSAADHASLRTGGVSWSLSTWVKLADVGPFRCIMAKGMATQTGEWALQVNNVGQFRIDLYNAGIKGQALSSGKSAGVWYHVVCWHDLDAGQVGLCVDGVTATGSTTGTIVDSSLPFTVGRYSSGTAFSFGGQVDETLYYRGRVLTADERQALRYIGLSGWSVADMVGGGTPTPSRPVLSSPYLIGDLR